jgi:hypothetical protein
MQISDSGCLGLRLLHFLHTTQSQELSVFGRVLSLANLELEYLVANMLSVYSLTTCLFYLHVVFSVQCREQNLNNYYYVFKSPAFHSVVHATLSQSAEEKGNYKESLDRQVTASYLTLPSEKKA